MSLVYNDPIIGSLVAKAAGFQPFLRDWHTSIGHVGTQLNAGVIYVEYTGSSVQMIAARFTKQPLSRGFFRAIFDYPFNNLGCKKVLALVRSRNDRALRLDLHLGFRVEAVITDWYPGDDQVILAMTKDQCRWLVATDGHLRNGQGRRGPEGTG